MSTPDHESAPAPAFPATASAVPATVTDSSGAHREGATPPAAPRELGGRHGPEPTRFGDWEKNGRCIDF